MCYSDLKDDIVARVRSFSGRPGHEVVVTLTCLVDDAVAMGAMTGKKVESVRIRCHMIMRLLYKSLIAGNIVSM